MLLWPLGVSVAGMAWHGMAWDGARWSSWAGYRWMVLRHFHLHMHLSINQLSIHPTTRVHDPRLATSPRLCSDGPLATLEQHVSGRISCVFCVYTRVVMKALKRSHGKIPGLGNTGLVEIGFG